jgi:hypothetical protein
MLGKWDSNSSLTARAVTVRLIKTVGYGVVGGRKPKLRAAEGNLMLNKHRVMRYRLGENFLPSFI